MKRDLLLVFLIIGFVCMQAFATEFQDITIISETDNQLVFEFTPSNYTLNDISVNSQVWKSINFDNSLHTSNSGEPDLPVRAVTLGIPADGDVQYQVLDSDVSSVQNIKIAPVPEFISDGEGGYSKSYDFEKSGNSNSVQNDAYTMLTFDGPFTFRNQKYVKLFIHPLQYTSNSKQLMQYTRIRVQVTFSGSQNQNKITTSVDENLYSNLLLNYKQALKWRILPTRSLKKSNTTQFMGDNWYSITITGDSKTAKRDANGDKEGMYKITGSVLQSAGVPISSIDPTTLQLFNNGGKAIPLELATHNPDSLIENAILVVGGNDGNFGASDYILFYGRSLESAEFDTTFKRLSHYIHPYSEENVYWLTWGKGEGKRMQSRTPLPVAGAQMQQSFRDLVFFEREEYNVHNSGIHWLDRSLSFMNPSRSYSFELKNVVPGELTIVRPVLGLISSSTHEFNIRVNGNNLGDASKVWYLTKQYAAFSAERTNNSVLMDGNNTVTINYNNTNDLDLAYVDYVEMEYGRKFIAVNDQLVFWGPMIEAPAAFPLTGFSGTVNVFDVTDFANVSQLSVSSSGGNVSFADDASADNMKKYIALTTQAYKTVAAADIKSVALANLRQPRQVDYIIITYDDFEQQAKTLESLRENWNVEDRLETEVVKISDINQEFGYGIKDPGAIRDFLAFASENWGNPLYVLLFGDGHFDYKNIRGLNTPNLIFPFETDEKHEDYTRATDDWYVTTSKTIDRPQMAIGRINAQTVDQAQAAVDKIEAYETTPEYGDWRNTVTFVGDDERQKEGERDQTEHTTGAETLSKINQIQMFDIKKIYLVEYRAVSSASISGYTKPDARQDLLDQINSGCLVLNYVGHGNDQRWAHEKVLYGPSDFDYIQNDKRQALWVAATCEFAHWDQVQEQSLAEELLYAKNRGAIGLVASSRVVYANNNIIFNDRFLKRLFQDYEQTGTTMRIGEAVLLAKLDIYSSTNIVNSEKYLYLGDPAMRLGAPRYKANIDEISPDSIQALRKMSLSGHVTDEDAKWSDFQGKVMVRVMDSPESKVYYTQESNIAINYTSPGNTLFRGTARITDGDFHLEFIVPKDISYNGSDGRINYYFWSDDSEGQGYQGGLVVGGTSTDLIDHEGPQLKLHFGDPDFAPGDYTSSNTTLHVDITDSTSGVNTAGDIGHQITMVMNDDKESVRDITEYFEYDEGSYVTGTVKYPLQQLPDGSHSIKVKAWDNSNNSGIVESDFVVVNSDELQLRDVVNYPNPMTDKTEFTFQISQDAMVEIKLYTVAGRLIKKFEPAPASVGFNIYPEIWDGHDQDGDKIANGVYLYVIKAVSEMDGTRNTVEEIGKMIIAR